MKEDSVTEDQVHDEHLAAVNVPAHWAYLLGVLGGGTLLMLVFIALLGGGA